MRSSYCSRDSIFREEPIFATVPRVNRWWLFEYPGPWKSDAIESARLPRSYARDLPPGERQLLIRHHYRWVSPLRCYLADSYELSSFLSRIDLLNYCEPVELEALPRTVVDGHLFLVCTHGTHDKCCAKFGLPVYKAIREIVGERAWQCSHVGGDRFAGNVVMMPEGVYYGHVSPEEAPMLIAACERGEIYLPAYRGRCSYPRIVQAAEYFLRRETGKLRWSDLRLVAWDRHSVRFSASEGEFHVELKRTRLPFNLLTCKAHEPAEPAPSFELVGIHLVND